MSKSDINNDDQSTIQQESNQSKTAEQPDPSKPEIRPSQPDTSPASPDIGPDTRPGRPDIRR